MYFKDNGNEGFTLCECALSHFTTPVLDTVLGHFPLLVSAVTCVGPPQIPLECFLPRTNTCPPSLSQYSSPSSVLQGEDSDILAKPVTPTVSVWALERTLPHSRFPNILLDTCYQYSSSGIKNNTCKKFKPGYQAMPDIQINILVFICLYLTAHLSQEFCGLEG